MGIFGLGANGMVQIRRMFTIHEKQLPLKTESNIPFCPPPQGQNQPRLVISPNLKYIIHLLQPSAQKK